MFEFLLFIFFIELFKKYWCFRLNLLIEFICISLFFGEKKQAWLQDELLNFIKGFTLLTVCDWIILKETTCNLKKNYLKLDSNEPFRSLMSIELQIQIQDFFTTNRNEIEAGTSHVILLIVHMKLNKFDSILSFGTLAYFYPG